MLPLNRDSASRTKETHSVLEIYRQVDRVQLARDMDEVRKRIGVPNQSDFLHLKKMQNWGRVFTLVGYGTAWIFPFNPLSALCIGIGNFSRWANVTHPVLHKGYDKVPEIPYSCTSRGHASGWRRWVDWMDWIRPVSWDVEHNELHHYRLGEKEDPGNMKLNMEWLRTSRWPIWFRYFVVVIFSFVWKVAYFSPSAETALAEKERLKNGGNPSQPLRHIDAWSLASPLGFRLWVQSFLPYAFYRFLLLPALFLPLGFSASINVFATTMIAEFFANFHSFLMIAPNHAGDDIYLFDGPANSKGEFYLRQILGSVNFTTGKDAVDFLHGYLNYQIEHHLFPNVPLIHYRKMQPEVKRVCEKHGIPYKQENVFRRLIKTLREMVDTSRMILVSPP
ncbi:MAG: fatty acid desaturase [Bdellovibrionales bacterium]|nr:fatty acid desaturase [Bdellovibrionales bacterium]